MVKILVSLPDKLAKLLGNKEEIVQQRLVEDAVAEAYRKGSLTRGEVGRFLKHNSWHQTEQFFVDHQIILDYNVDDIKHDIRVAKRFFDTK